MRQRAVPAERRAVLRPRSPAARPGSAVCAPLLWAIGAVAGGVSAQEAPPAVAGGAPVAAAGGTDAAAATGGGATAGGPRRLPLAFVPSLSLSQTFLRGDSQSPGNQRFESVTQLSPGVHVSSGGGRVVGFLDYTLNVLRDTADAQGNDIRHALNSALKAELIEGRGFVDANASISQQLISARGQQYASDLLDRQNRSQVTAYSVSPYLVGLLGGQVRYEGRLNYSASHSGGASTADSDASGALLRLSGGTGFSAASWGLVGNHDVLDYASGRRTTSDRVSADLSYVLAPQSNLSIRAGRESSDIVSADKRSATTWGFGGAWRPGNLTSLTYNQERRIYGDTHALNFSYRTAHAVLSYTDNRDISTGTQQAALGSVGSVYDLLYQLSTQPDLVLRDREVRAELQQRGLSANAQVLTEFLTSAATSQRRQTLSMAWLGLRDSATLALSQSRSNRVDRVASVVDDLSTTNNIRQRGFTLTVTHRLTPLSSLSLNGSLQRTSGDDTFPASRLSSFDVAWNGQLGPRTSATLSARRTTFSGGTSPYTETAVTGGVNLRF